MEFLEKLKYEIEHTPEVELVGFFYKRPLFDAVTKSGYYLPLKDMSNKWLKNTFPEYINYNGFVQSCYNLIKFLPKDINEEHFKKLLKSIETKSMFNISYYNGEDEDYYVVNGEPDEESNNTPNPFACFYLSIIKKEDIGELKKENLIPLSKLKEFMIYNPGCVIMDLFNNDKKIMKKLKKQKLAIKMTRKEKKF